MDWIPTLYTYVGILAAGLCLGAAVYASKRRTHRAAHPFIALLVTLAIWSLIYAVQLGFPTANQQLAWQGLTLGVAGIVPTLWVLFVLQYANYDILRSRRWLAILAINPVLFFVFSVTNSLHNLVWAHAEPVDTTVGMTLGLTFAGGYYLHIIYAYGLMLIGFAFLLQAARTSRTYRNQATLVVLGTVPPFFAHIAYTLGIGPIPSLDLTPFLFSLTGIVFVFGLFSFEFLDRSALARERALKGMGDGIVVVDEQGQVEEINMVAQSVLDPEVQVGSSIHQAIAVSDLTELDGRILSTEQDGSTRDYNLRIWPLLNQRNRPVGHVIVLRDVTELRAYQQQLEVSNRVLRHNLRNSMTVINGYAADLETDAGGEHAEAGRIIRDRSEQLLDTAEKARAMTTISEQQSTDTSTFDIVDHTQHIISEFRTTHPDYRLTFDAPPSLMTEMSNQESITIALENLLENAIVHNNPDTTEITVTILPDDDQITITITDNGVGIPEIELSTIAQGSETAVQHGQGMGLWLAYWGARTSGGTLDLDSDQHGTTATITLPCARMEQVD